jgi:hypothetical protein
VDLSATDEFCWQLRRLALSGRFDQYRRELARLRLPADTEQMLLAILLVEGTQRPAWVRAVEWAVWWAFQVVGRPTLGPRTRGPFQLRDAPFAFAAAARLAAQLLQDVDHRDPRRVAALWYGSESRHPRSTFSYIDALNMALRVLQTAVVRPSAGPKSERSH